MESRCRDSVSDRPAPIPIYINNPLSLMRGGGGAGGGGDLQEKNRSRSIYRKKYLRDPRHYLDI